MKLKIMDMSQETSIPSNLILISLLSTGITTVISISYIILSTIGLVYRFKCEVAKETSYSQYFWHTVYKVYVQDESCGEPQLKDNLTTPYTFYVFLSIVLTFSILTLITSLTLAATVRNKGMFRYLNIFVFAYVGTCVGAMIVDIVFASHLGIDYSNLSKELDKTTWYDAELDAMTKGAFMLLSIVMKGFIGHAFNLLFIAFLIAYACNYEPELKYDEHPIRNLGPLHAYDRSLEDIWFVDTYASPVAHNNNVYGGEETPDKTSYFHNPAFVSDQFDSSPNPSPPRRMPPSRGLPPSRGDFTSRPNRIRGHVLSPVREESPGQVVSPKVPKPDYSPQMKLKSALKTNNYNYYYEN